MKRYAKDTTIYIVPGLVFGRSNRCLLLSMPGYGSVEVLAGYIVPMDVYRLGINIRLSRALATALNTVFNFKE